MTLKAGKKDQNDLMFDSEFADNLSNDEDMASPIQSPASNLSAQSPAHSSTQLDAPPSVPLEEAMQDMVEKVVNKLTPTLQSLIVSERVLEAQKAAEDWKAICNLMASNPEVINEKLSIRNGPTQVFRRLNADLSDPSTVTWTQFLQLPMSQPVWSLMINFEINQNDPIWEKWWKKIKNDHKDAFTKMCKYLQALTNFNKISEIFWMQMALNPSAWSAQKIIMYLTAQGDWLRSGNYKHLLKLQSIQTHY